MALLRWCKLAVTKAMRFFFSINERKYPTKWVLEYKIKFTKPKQQPKVEAIQQSKIGARHTEIMHRNVLQKLFPSCVRPSSHHELFSEVG